MVRFIHQVSFNFVAEQLAQCQQSKPKQAVKMLQLQTNSIQLCMVFHPKSPIKGQHARILSELKNWGSAPWAACRVTFRPIRAIFETDGRVFTSFWFSGSQFDGGLNLCYPVPSAAVRRQSSCKRSGGRARARTRAGLRVAFSRKNSSGICFIVTSSSKANRTPWLIL